MTQAPDTQAHTVSTSGMDWMIAVAAILLIFGLGAVLLGLFNGPPLIAGSIVVAGCVLLVGGCLLLGIRSAARAIINAHG